MGRVSGATRFTTYGLQPFAQMVAGLVAAALPVDLLFALAGAAGMAVGGVGYGTSLHTSAEALAVPAEAVAG